MKFHVACGGTGGHIFPGLATAEQLRLRGHEVTLWLAGKDVEGPALDGWRDRVITVPSEGFQGGGPLRVARTVWRLIQATHACRRIMAKAPPDALLAMGSYASIGPVRAAVHLKVPVVLHEANVIPGKAISMLASRATTVAAAFEETHYHLRRRKLEITGMPMRGALVAAAHPTAPRPPDAPFTVLALGGSGGARALNLIFAEAVARAERRRDGFHWIHLTGKAHEAEAREQYARTGVNADIRGFCPNIESLYNQADLVICRAGASTCAELALYGLPSLLIPYPHAARNHQEANARVMEKNGAADVVLEDDVDADWLAEYIVGMRDAPDRLERMRTAARRRAHADAAAALASCVERAGTRGGPAV